MSTDPKPNTMKEWGISLSRPNRFRFVQDDDGHWYLIPNEQTQAFEFWARQNELVKFTPSEIRSYRFEDRRLSGGVEQFTFEKPKED